MKLALDLIQPSPSPLRSSWDEDKLRELTESIKEQGLIVPIKVRPVNGQYEIVYGHRRAEACNRAGLTEIECNVEEMEWAGAQIQALIENIQREDMEPLDLARALVRLQANMGWSIREMDRQKIMPATTIRKTIALLQEAPSVQQLIRRGHEGGKSPIGQISTEHVALAREAGTTPEQRAPLLRRAADEGWGRERTQRVAKAMVRAEDESEREAILTTDPSDPMFDRLVKARAQVHRQTQREQHKKREDDPREVRQFLDAMRSFYSVLREAGPVVDYGKFSPEAKRFAIRQLDKLEQEIQTLRKRLEE